jgi:hypothetical protein
MDDLLEYYKNKLENLATHCRVETIHYFDESNGPQVWGDYCGDCSEWIVSLTRCKLVMDCLALLAHPIHTQRYYQFYQPWWEFSCWGGSEIHPHTEICAEKDSMTCCDRCGVMLSYSLTEYGVETEIAHFESLDVGSVDSRQAYQLWRVFQSGIDLEIEYERLAALGEKFLGKIACQALIIKGRE